MRIVDNCLLQFRFGQNSGLWIMDVFVETER